MEKLLVVDNNPIEAKKLTDLSSDILDKLGKGHDFVCIASDNIANAIELVRQGVFFLITNIDLGRGLIDWDQTGVKVVYSACELGKHDRHRMCIYGEEFPAWTPKMAGVNRIPRYRIDDQYLLFFLKESSIRAN